MPIGSSIHFPHELLAVLPEFVLCNIGLTTLPIGVAIKL
jgi:hypothetical protein